MLLMDVAHSTAFIIVLVFLLSCHCLFTDPSCITCTDLHSVTVNGCECGCCVGVLISPYRQMWFFYILLKHPRWNKPLHLVMKVATFLCGVPPIPVILVEPTLISLA